MVVNSKAEWDQVLNEAKNSGKAVSIRKGLNRR